MKERFREPKVNRTLPHDPIRHLRQRKKDKRISNIYTLTHTHLQSQSLLLVFRVFVAKRKKEAFKQLEQNNII